MAKATNAEVEQRISKVFSMLVEGASYGEIVRHAAEKWKLSDRQTDTYIKRAKIQLSEHAQVERAEEFGKALARLSDLYKRALKLHDFRTALSVQKEINAVMGHYPPVETKSKLTLDGELDLKHSADPEQYNRALGTLADALRAGLHQQGADQSGAVDTAKRPAVVSNPE
jgi:hypothetical protein